MEAADFVRARGTESIGCCRKRSSAAAYVDARLAPALFRVLEARVVNEWKNEFESLGRLQPEYRKLCLERVKKLIGQIDTCEVELRHVQLAERHSNVCIHIVDVAAEVRV